MIKVLIVSKDDYSLGSIIGYFNKYGFDTSHVFPKIEFINNLLNNNYDLIVWYNEDKIELNIDNHTKHVYIGVNKENIYDYNIYYDSPNNYKVIDYNVNYKIENQTYYCDIIVITDRYIDDKQKILDYIYYQTDYKLHIYGPVKYGEIYPDSYKGEYNSQQCNELINASKINIFTNFGIHKNYMLGSGTLLLIEEKYNLDEILKNNYNCIYFDDTYEQINHILNNYDKYEYIKSNAVNSMQNNTWDKIISNLTYNIYPEIRINKQYDNKHIFIGIGEFCIWGSILKSSKLKKQSFPFDWIFSNLIFVNESLNDNFKTLLTTLEQKKNTCDKEYIGELISKVSIPHKDVVLHETYEYYERCIQRFNKALNSDKSVVFLYCSLTFDKINSTHLYILRETINKKYPNLIFRMVILKFIYHEKREDHIFTETINGNIHIINIYSQIRFIDSIWRRELETFRGIILTELLNVLHNDFSLCV
jgi:hypothetical protein